MEWGHPHRSNATGSDCAVEEPCRMAECAGWPACRNRCSRHRRADRLPLQRQWRPPLHQRLAWRACRVGPAVPPGRFFRAAEVWFRREQAFQVSNGPPRMQALWHHCRRRRIDGPRALPALLPLTSLRAYSKGPFPKAKPPSENSCPARSNWGGRDTGQEDQKAAMRGPDVSRDRGGPPHRPWR